MEKLNYLFVVGILLFCQNLSLCQYKSKTFFDGNTKLTSDIYQFQKNTPNIAFGVFLSDKVSFEIGGAVSEKKDFRENLTDKSNELTFNSKFQLYLFGRPKNLDLKNLFNPGVGCVNFGRHKKTHPFSGLHVDLGYQFRYVTSQSQLVVNSQTFESNYNMLNHGVITQIGFEFHAYNLVFDFGLSSGIEFASLTSDSPLIEEVFNEKSSSAGNSFSRPYFKIGFNF